MAELYMGEILEEKLDDKKYADIERKLITNEDKVYNGDVCDSESKDDMSLSVLETLASSDFINDRLLAVRFLVRYLNQCMLTEQLTSIVGIMCKLSEDEDQSVKSEFIHIIPSVALICKDDVATFCVMFRQFLGPYIMKLLTDDSSEVRQIGNSALVFAVENGLIDDFQLSEWICPQIAELWCESSNADQMLENCIILCELIPLVPTDCAEKFLLKQFISQTRSHVAIRVVCVKHFDKVCEVFGYTITEYKLLPTFLNLCNDDDWSVRVECTKVFKGVSATVSEKKRTEVLTDFFLNLLNDRDRLVRDSAADHLGEFISTFYLSPSLQKSFEHKAFDGKSKDELTSIVLPVSDNYSVHENFKVYDAHDFNSNIRDLYEGKNRFNSFQFWKNPFPDIETELDALKDSHSSICISSESKQIMRNTELEVKTEIDITDFFLIDELSIDKLSKQSKIPPQLLSRFMFLAKKEHTCVRAFPAVVLTLGKEHWYCLRNLFLHLSFSVKPEVKCMIASSLHELVVILEGEIAATDLVPIFVKFLKDTSVRHKIVKIMFSFLSALKDNNIQPTFILPLLQNLVLNTDEKDWRYRHLIITELEKCYLFFTPMDVFLYILPIVQARLEDKVSEVRIKSIHLISSIVKWMFDSSCSRYVNILLSDLEVHFSQSDRWIKRQMYILLCEQLYYKNICLRKVLRPLFSLADDKVPNVRIALSRCMLAVFRPSNLGQILRYEEDKERILSVLQCLKDDKDPDVMFFVSQYLDLLPKDILLS